MAQGLQALNAQGKMAEWSARISACRNSGQSVKGWCKENGVCEQTYYKWQRRLFALAKAQQETQLNISSTLARPGSQRRYRRYGAPGRGRSGDPHRSGCRCDRNRPADPEDMLNDFSCNCPVYIACGYTNLPYRSPIDFLRLILVFLTLQFAPNTFPSFGHRFNGYRSAEDKQNQISCRVCRTKRQSTECKKMRHPLLLRGWAMAGAAMCQRRSRQWMPVDLVFS